jgi:predicted nucleotidyltransferase
MQPAIVSNKLKELARLLADWAAPARGITVYLFGSRVRGDHRPDSDVDVCFQWEGRPDVHWWQTNNEQDFAAIKPKLPGPLAIHPEQDPWWAPAVAAEVVYQDRNVRCVWLPPKPQQ